MCGCSAAAEQGLDFLNNNKWLKGRFSQSAFISPARLWVTSLSPFLHASFLKKKCFLPRTLSVSLSLRHRLCELQGQPPPTLIFHGRDESPIFLHGICPFNDLGEDARDLKVLRGEKGENDGKQNRGRDLKSLPGGMEGNGSERRRRQKPCGFLSSVGGD